MIINPGSATDRRRQPHHSMVVIEVEGDGPPAVRFVNLDDDGANLPAELIRSVQ
jgi:predicted phosphodiesterase